MTRVIHCAPAKRSAPFSPPLPAKRSATSSWSACQDVDAEKPVRACSSGQDDDSRLMLTISVGGSTDSDDTDVTVMPVMSLPRPTVMTLTPPARWRMAPRKSAEETSRSIVMLRTAEFMAASQV